MVMSVGLCDVSSHGPLLRWTLQASSHPLKPWSCAAHLQHHPELLHGSSMPYASPHYWVLNPKP